MRDTRILVILATITFFLAVPTAFSEFVEDAPQIELTTTSFLNGEVIPAKHTCDGANDSPALKLSKGPQGTESFALLMEDPDAPSGIWTHWILYNLPPRVYTLPPQFPPVRVLANSERHGTNDFGNLGRGIESAYQNNQPVSKG